MLTAEETRILSRINVPVNDTPDQPEYPPDNPKFPATSTYKIEVPGFKDVWLKDESSNKYSGTHKDRLAWEVIVLYRDILIAKQEGKFPGKLPQFSIISSGSAALAISRMLKHYGLPKLKVLLDIHIDPAIYKAIEESHCEIYRTDLRLKELSAVEILKLTNNPEGFDLTSNKGISLEIGNFDWFSFELLNESPDFIFIPFGTGTIFKKVLETAKNIIKSPGSDARYKGNIVALRHCSYLGATTHNPASVADKLFSQFLPFNDINSDWLRFYETAGFCGPQTGIYEIEESFLKEAMDIAKSQNIKCEPSGIAGLALLLQMQDQIPHDKKILIVNTGKLKLH